MRIDNRQGKSNLDILLWNESFTFRVAGGHTKTKSGWALALCANLRLGLWI